ncbi:MAG: ribosomal protein S18-alanine N-acetyltransferase [Gammaproteobacteria bacterium]|nr:ribosomal protein S18-alanine N-acetyltransferase [Gammaproteobacteria bacterium]
MRPPDLAAVVEVERQCYEFPWRSSVFQDCMRAGYVCVVADCAGTVCGYGIMSVAAGECHILNLCVRPDCRRRGLGRSLLQALTTIARDRDSRTAFLEVRVSNRAAQDLYAQDGFNEIATRHQYYRAKSGREDALVFAKTL